MTAGLTPTGFVAKTVEEIKTELEGAMRADLGADVDTSAESVLGQLVAIVATRERTLWELAEIVYNARVPKGASFASLTELARITGTERRAATKGTVTLGVTLTAGTTLPPGSVAAVAGQPSNRWVTAAAVANPGPGTATVSAYAEAETAGVVRANNGTITVIATPVAGWTAVTNAADAKSGFAIESDAQLRERREAELSRTGTGTVPGLRADLLDLGLGVATFSALSGAELEAVQGAVLSIAVATNRSAWPDAEGRAPHTTEAVVLWKRGLDPGRKALAVGVFALQLYWSSPAGIGWHGTQSAVVTNPNGESETVRWSEASDVQVYVDVVLSTGSGYGDDADTKAAIVEWSEALLLGEDVIRARLYPVLLALPGVLDVIEIRLGRTVATTQQNLTMGPREAALFDTSRITVMR